MPSSNYPLSVLHTNIRGIIPNRDDLQCVVYSSSADVVVLTENWLHSDLKHGELFGPTSDFTIYRCDRMIRGVVGS